MQPAVRSSPPEMATWHTDLAHMGDATLPPGPAVHCRLGGRYSLPTFLKYRARFLLLAVPLPSLVARPSCCSQEDVGAKRARPPPPPGMATAPKPGMIAEIGGSPAVKNLALGCAFGSCPVVQSVQENAGCSLFPPPGAARLFSCPRPVRCHKAPPSALALPADDTPRYGHLLVGGPGPIGPARSGISGVRGREILRSSPKIHREFIAAGYGLGGVSPSPERLLLLSRAARWCPLDAPPSPLSLFTGVRGETV
jgi:hypothetical protein